MRFDVMTLFPEMIDGIVSYSIIGRAQEKGIIEIHSHNIRDYSEDNTAELTIHLAVAGWVCS